MTRRKPGRETKGSIATRVVWLSTTCAAVPIHRMRRDAPPPDDVLGLSSSRGLQRGKMRSYRTLFTKASAKNTSQLQVVVEEGFAVPYVAVDELPGLGRDLCEPRAEPWGRAVAPRVR